MIIHKVMVLEYLSLYIYIHTLCYCCGNPYSVYHSQILRGNMSLSGLTKRIRDLGYKAASREHAGPGFTAQCVITAFTTSCHCDMCATVFLSDSEKRLDHCHTTGAFRGILCDRCNTSLGHFEAALPRIDWVMEYLSPHRSSE